MPKKRAINLPEKVNRRNFKLTNKAGQLGRQGVHGPVERMESKIMGLGKLKKPKGL